MVMGRDAWLNLADDQLLAQCAVDLYRASGPGGQKRNKTSSAVRMRHGPSGVMAIAEESRSQFENKARALKRVRQEIALHVREPFAPIAVKLEIGRRDERFWHVAGLVLDGLEFHEARVRETAESLQSSTSRLIGFLKSHESLWRRTNELRQRHGRKPLH